ncbi:MULTISPECIES: hypothetical protein [Streptomyces]|uniref:hypothetical protein n=1 Tax=Streptomyces TaxID=1883 RepID=UPI00131BF248|nr:MULTISPECIES: hypothetical protein [Streptomyces]
MTVVTESRFGPALAAKMAPRLTALCITPEAEVAISARDYELNAPITEIFEHAARLIGMGIDWENMLGASGNGLSDAYDSTVSAVIYSEAPGGDCGPLPVGEEHDDADGLL